MGGDDGGGACSSLSAAGDEDSHHRKQNHCEIEKRRRDKMNHYIMQLASVLPSFNCNQSKLDKLTVLRMAVQHVKSLRSSLCSFSSFHLRPSFLSSGNVLKNLILQMTSQEAQDNLFMVITCDRAKVLFVSKSSKDILNQAQDELVGQSLFDILHKDDVSKVKEQISYFNLIPKELVVDSRTLQPIKSNQKQSYMQIQNQSNSTLQPGARRSFFCRIKSGRIWPLPHHQELQQERAASRTTNSASQPCKEAHVGQSSNKSASSPTARAASCAAPSSSSGSEVSKSNRFYSHSLERKQQKAQLGSSGSSSGNSSCTSSSLETNSDEKNAKRINSESSSIARTESVAKHQRRSDGETENGYSARTTAATSDVSVASLGTPLHSNESIQSSADLKKTSHPAKGTSSSSPSSAAKRGQASSAAVRRKQWRYIVMHCTGYLKSITLNSDEYDDDDESDNCDSDADSKDEGISGDKSKTVNCLVAVCRRSVIDRHLKPEQPLTFTCRYSMEGKFVFVDQRTTVALGYTPQQLIGTSHYAYCHKDSVNTFKECHRRCILESEAVSSDIYQFKRANGQYMWLQTSLKSFRNPWTKFIDYIVANHTTAEGNDPRYNEGCVPTKFNQDMTGEASQSSSPASSSSISSQSAESKKSTSPSSSSMGSSYSMGSYASGASIQALLNQIDRVKSGGLKHALDFNKKRSCDATRSTGSSSARKSNDDSGNFSDMQSCSSISSQNSTLSADYLNMENVNNLVNAAPTNKGAINGQQRQPQPQLTRQQQDQSIACTNNPFYFTKDHADFRAPPTNTAGQRTLVNCDSQVNAEASYGQRSSANDQAPILRSTTTAFQKPPVIRAGKPMLHSGKPVQQNSGYHQYYQQNQNKPMVMSSNGAGSNESSWLPVPEQIYSSVLSEAHRPDNNQTAPSRTENQHSLCTNTANNELQHRASYFFETDAMRDPIGAMPSQLDLQANRVFGISTFSDDLMQPVDTYMAVASPEQRGYPTSSDIGLDHMAGSSNRQLSNTDELQQTTMAMTLQEQQSSSQGRTVQQASEQTDPQQAQAQPLHPAARAHLHQQQQQHHQHHQHQGGGMMIWNAPSSSSGSYPNIIHNVIQSPLMSNCQQANTSVESNGLINMDVGNSNGQMIVQPHQQQVVHYQQCAGHKCCSNQPLMMPNNYGDLNNLHLSSLAVDDLDENELLECLAACDPDAQLYNIQNSSYPKYNIYRD